jgi:hypothetical protein
LNFMTWAASAIFPVLTMLPTSATSLMYGSNSTQCGVGELVSLLIPCCIPAIWFLLITKGSSDSSHYRVCGYDLRATPDRCPECGTISKPAKYSGM